MYDALFHSLMRGTDPRLVDRFGSVKRSHAGTTQRMAELGLSQREVPRHVPDDLADHDYVGQRRDPYSEAAAFHRELGRRMPDPYAAKAAEAHMLNAAIRRKEVPRTDLGARHAVFVGRDVAGRRQTPWRTHGSGAQTPSHAGDPFWDMRLKAGYAPLGTRDSGYSEEWDSPEFRRRRSGRTREGFQQHVYGDRPFLSLTTRPQNHSAHVRLTAGHQNGGAEMAREFFIGAGFTTQSLLAGYDTMSLEILALQEDDTQVVFAWVADGLQAGESSYFLPQVVSPGGGQAVPEGAFAIVAASSDPNWRWTTPAVPGYSFPTAGPGVTAATRVAVAGSTFTAGRFNDVVWFLRPL